MRELKSYAVPGGPETCTALAEEKLGPGGAPHHYEIKAGVYMFSLDFQKGGVKESGLNGITHEALLAIIIDRLEHFQKGPFPSQDNQDALSHAKSALQYLQKRTRSRIMRNVEGILVA